MRTRIRRYQTVRIERHLCRWVEDGRRCSKAGGVELAREIEARLNRVEFEEIPFVDFSSVHIFTRTNPKSTTYQLCWREKGKRVFFSLGKGATLEFAEAMRRIKAFELMPIPPWKDPKLLNDSEWEFVSLLDVMEKVSFCEDYRIPMSETVNQVGTIFFFKSGGVWHKMSKDGWLAVYIQN